MPLLLLPFLLGLVAIGVWRLYDLVAGMWGSAAGMGAIIILIAIAAMAVTGVIKRHRYYHGKKIAGKRILSTDGPWGKLALDALNKQGWITVQAHTHRFLFSDIQQVRHLAKPAPGTVSLVLRHAVPSEWLIPFDSDRKGQRWHKILMLAAEQKL